MAAIALFKQATEATAGPVQQDTQQTTKVICHDPWVSFILTLLIVLGMIAYMYNTVGNFQLFMDINLPIFVKFMSWPVQKHILSKLK